MTSSNSEKKKLPARTAQRQTNDADVTTLASGRSSTTTDDGLDGHPQDALGSARSTVRSPTVDTGRPASDSADTADRRRNESDNDRARARLVARLVGLLVALVGDDTTTPDAATTETHPDGSTLATATADTTPSTAYPERTGSRGEYGTRTEAVDAQLGATGRGDPVVPERSALMRARTNTHGAPADTLAEPDTTAGFRVYSRENVSSRFVDPTGSRVVGVASGLDERVRQPDPGAHHAVSDRRRQRPLYDLDTLDPDDRERLARLRAYDQPADTPTGTDTDAQSGESRLDARRRRLATLDVFLPGGGVASLGTVTDDPLSFAGVPTDGIEQALGLAAETSRITDGIDSVRPPAPPNATPTLSGAARLLDAALDNLAAARPSQTALDVVRREAAAQRRRDRLRPLVALDADTHDEVCAMARRLLSEEFDRVSEVRKQPLTLAVELAARIERGATLDSALLTQADAEATDPKNVQRIENLRWLSTDTTWGRVHTEGRVTTLFEHTHPELLQAGVLSDETGSVRFAIWRKSTWPDTGPTADPNDVGGRTVVRDNSQPRLYEGDFVRFENVHRGWYGSEVTLATRRDSVVTVVEPAPETVASGEDDDRQSGVETTGDTDHVTDTGSVKRRTLRPRPNRLSSTGTQVAKPRAAYWRGRVTWTFPVVDWTPSWWIEHPAVHPDDDAERPHGSDPADDDDTDL